MIGDFHYNGHQLAGRRTGLRRGAGASTASIRATSASARRSDTQFAQLIEFAHPLRQAGAHRRQLGFAGPVAGGAADGRERPARRALGRQPRAARGADPLGAGFGRTRGRDRPAARTHRAELQGQRRAGTDRGLSRPRPALAISRCTWASPRPASAARASSPRSAALAVLLQEGIGDTIRISLTPEPGAVAHAGSHRRAGTAADHRPARVHADGHRVPGLRAHHVGVLPGTGGAWCRTTCARKMPEWKVSHPGAENMTLAVMGCVVNGPGESRHANIGISLPGTGEAPDRAGVHRWREGDDPARREHRAASSSP